MLALRRGQQLETPWELQLEWRPCSRWAWGSATAAWVTAGDPVGASVGVEALLELGAGQCAPLVRGTSGMEQADEV